MNIHQERTLPSSTSVRDSGTTTSDLWKRIKLHRWHYLFILPMLILFLMFSIWPIVGSWYYAFFNWDGTGRPSNFIGFNNFIEIYTDPGFWNAFKVTFSFAISNVCIQLPLALIVAVILNHPAVKGRNIYRLLIFLPVISTTAVVGIVFVILLNPLGGPINDALLKMGLIDSPINFLGSQKLALPTLLVISLWKSFGTPLIYWLAGLQTIPAELYEAAKIDGAGAVQRFTRITIPLLVPIGIIIVLLTFIANLHPFDLVKTMTEGGPVKSTDVIDTYIYRYAFETTEYSSTRYGFASAAGIVFSMAVFLIVLVQAAVMKKVRPGKGGQSV
jgi:raffinose/stachyose/melibiose transport system permease protein